MLRIFRSLMLAVPAVILLVILLGGAHLVHEGYRNYQGYCSEGSGRYVH